MEEGGVVISLTKEEVLRLEAILLDKDKDEALKFLQEVLKPKLK